MITDGIMVKCSNSGNIQVFILNSLSAIIKLVKLLFTSSINIYLYKEVVASKNVYVLLSLLDCTM